MADRTDNVITTQAIPPAGLEANIGAPKHLTGSRVKKWSAAKTAMLALLVAIAIAAVAGFGFAVYGVYSYNKVYPGVTVDGVSMAGLTNAEAAQKILAMFQGKSPARSFAVTIADTTYPVEVTADNLGYNTDKTALSVWLYGRQGSFFTRLGSIISSMRLGHEIVPEFVMNSDSLKLRAEEIARDAQKGLIEASFTFDGQMLIIDRGQAGAGVDSAALSAFFEDKLTRGDFSDCTYEISYQEPNMLDLLLVKNQVDSQMQNPCLDLEADPAGGIIIPAKVGYSLDVSAAKAALDATEDRYVRIPVEINLPAYTTEEYQAMLFRDVLAEGTTSFNAGLKGRTTNVLLANGFLNSVILNPGDVFSYNETVGPRTYERGFMDAIVYVGASAEDGVGGGICQVSSTLYYACLRADLEIVERRAHSRMVTYVPLGEDATVAWGAVDYRFCNNTDFPIKIVTSNTSNTITIQLIGTQTVANKRVEMKTDRLSSTPFEVIYVVDPTLPVGTTKDSSAGYTGYRTETYRVVYIDNVEVSRTFENKSSYAKYDKVILHNPAPETTVPPASEPPATLPGSTDSQTTDAWSPIDGTDPETQPGTQPDAETEPPSAPNNFPDTTADTQPDEPDTTPEE